MDKVGILYLSCGVPGSGKSTFLEEMKGEDEVIVSRDKIRFQILRPGEDYFSRDKEVYAKFMNEIVRNIRNGVNVYADATHLDEKSRYLLISQLRHRGLPDSTEINAIYFNVPLKVCKERNEMRRGTKTYVPIYELEHMYCVFSPPSRIEGFSNIWEVNQDGEVEIIY